MTDPRTKNTYRPPEGRRLTEFAVHLVTVGQSIGIPTMVEDPDLWMEVVDRMCRGWSWVAIADWLGVRRSHTRKLRARGWPTMHEARQVASVCLYAYHATHDAAASVEELCGRMGVGATTMHHQCVSVTGQTPGTVRRWSVADVLRTWSQEREAVA